jgi:hypothetical protein
LKENNRFHTKFIKSGDKMAHETPTDNYLINIKSEKPKKSTEKLMIEAANLKKMRKVKYITE